FEATLKVLLRWLPTTALNARPALQRLLQESYVSEGYAAKWPSPCPTPTLFRSFLFFPSHDFRLWVFDPTCTCSTYRVPPQQHIQCCGGGCSFPHAHYRFARHVHCDVLVVMQSTIVRPAH